MNCRIPRTDATLDVHHIVPRGQGGSDRFSNLVALCRQCHDAAHGKAMAPVVRWYSNGQMDSVEFEAYRHLWKTIDWVRFNEEGRFWYIPLGDIGRFVDEPLIEDRERMPFGKQSR
ncbi:HNH endonuclease [Halopelagius longus]